MKFLALLLFAHLLAISTASAQSIIPSLDDPGHKGELARAEKKKAAERFDSYDEDKDGKLSREEVAKHSRYLIGSFDKHDTNKDGFLSWEEFLGHNRWPK